MAGIALLRPPWCKGPRGAAVVQLAAPGPRRVVPCKLGPRRPSRVGYGMRNSARRRAHQHAQRRRQQAVASGLRLAGAVPPAACGRAGRPIHPAAARQRRASNGAGRRTRPVLMRLKQAPGVGPCPSGALPPAPSNASVKSGRCVQAGESRGKWKPPRRRCARATRCAPDSGASRAAAGNAGQGTTPGSSHLWPARVESWGGHTVQRRAAGAALLLLRPSVPRLLPAPGALNLQTPFPAPRGTRPPRLPLCVGATNPPKMAHQGGLPAVRVPAVQMAWGGALGSLVARGEGRARRGRGRAEGEGAGGRRARGAGRAQGRRRGGPGATGACGGAGRK
jgi:hypothetical protein